MIYGTKVSIPTSWTKQGLRSIMISKQWASQMIFKLVEGELGVCKNLRARLLKFQRTSAFLISCNWKISHDLSAMFDPLWPLHRTINLKERIHEIRCYISTHHLLKICIQYKMESPTQASKYRRRPCRSEGIQVCRRDLRRPTDPNPVWIPTNPIALCLFPFWTPSIVNIPLLPPASFCQTTRTDRGSALGHL